MTKDEKKDMKKIAEAHKDSLPRHEEVKTLDPVTVVTSSRSSSELQDSGHETKKDALPKHEEQKAIIESCDKHAVDLEDQLKRVQAEFENYKKRVAKEKEELDSLTTAATIKRLLPVLEEFELAVNHAKDKMDEKDELLAGFEMVLKNLKSGLEKQGLREMECLGEPFDPYKHEAIRSGHSEMPEGKIIDVAKKGYYFKDKVLRHASVVVSKGHIAEGKTCKECG